MTLCPDHTRAPRPGRQRPAHPQSGRDQVRDHVPVTAAEGGGAGRVWGPGADAGRGVKRHPLLRGDLHRAAAGHEGASLGCTPTAG